MIRKLICIAVFFLLISACQKKVEKESKPEVFTEVKTVDSYTYEQLKPLLEKKDGKTYVVNFWATWCAPCVKELPYFEQINQEYAAKNVEVLLVSLDFPKQVEKKLIPFINRKKLSSKVVLLDDVNENFWIPAIDSTWSGALPATLIYNTKKRKFYEQSFDYNSLDNELKTFLKY